MPLSINLPTNHVDNDAGHTAGHNATNTAVNATAAAVDTHTAATTSVHGIADTSALATTSALTSGLAGKANTSHTHAASDVASGTLAAARLGSGSTGGTTRFLREDSTWTVPGGSQPWQFRVSDYAATGDGQMIRDVATTNGSAIITSAAGKFVSGDVGKSIMISGAIGAANIPLITTIASYQSATQVTLAANATATATGLPALWGTDDTTAIRNALTAAGSYARGHNFYAEVLFDASTYVLSAAPAQSTSPTFNAQLPIPVPTDNTDRKLEISLIGAGTNSHLQFWAATVPSLLGTCLVSMRTAPNPPDATFGVQSVIGAPTAYAGFTGSFANVKPVLRNLSVVCPAYTNITAIDFSQAAGCLIEGVSSHIFANPVSGGGTLLNTMTADSAFQGKIGCGLRTPGIGNNADVTISDFASEGYTVGLRVPAEHVYIGNLKTIYNDVALIIDDVIGLSNFGHELVIDQWTAEVYNGGILTTGTGNAAVDINMVTENSGSAYDVRDDSNVLKGEFRFYSPDATNVHAVTITGAAGLRVLDRRNSPGHVTAPSVPATTVAQKNTFWRDAAVNISGGTVTAIAVDGTATGLTSGTVIIPSGKTITLTYSSAPSWNWTLL